MKHKTTFSALFFSWVCVNISAGNIKPNVLIILADDMGYSDVGCYGGEIPTPNIDSLAENGVRFSNFYNTSRSCPSRASLMTGLFQHQTGIGQMSEDPVGGIYQPSTTCNDWGTDGYKGFLNRNCVTIEEVLKESGYHTYMVGKWHLGMHGMDKWPLQRGFERFYGILSGACSYLRPSGGRGLTLDNEKLPSPESGYYTTDAFTDYALKFIGEQKDDSPFFMYVAYNAPHWPLQAHQTDIDKFVKYYRSKGWNEIREERRKRMLESGLIDEKWELSEWENRNWDELSAEEKDEAAYRMAVYAAQVHCMDRNIGRIIDELKSRKLLDNTLIFFLSDNGACAEPYKELGGGTLDDINNPGKSGSISYGRAWAQVSNTPYRKYKNRSYEGGISTPLIVSWMSETGKMSGRIVSVKGYLPDIMPTILEATNCIYPKTFHDGNVITPLVGHSLLKAVKERSAEEIHQYMYWEHGSNAACSRDKWKAVRCGENGVWELYNLRTDRTERYNVANNYPEILDDLVAHWNKWAVDYKVYPKRMKYEN